MVKRAGRLDRQIDKDIRQTELERKREKDKGKEINRVGGMNRDRLMYRQTSQAAPRQPSCKPTPRTVVG